MAPKPRYGLNSPRSRIKIYTSAWQDLAWISLPDSSQLLYLAIASAPIPRDSSDADWADLLRVSVARVARWRAALTEAGALVDGEPVWTHICTNRCLEGPRPRAYIPDSLRLAVYERDGYRCVTCGVDSPLSLDHIIPWSLGGEDTMENLQTMCRPCNSRKGARV